MEYWEDILRNQLNFESSVVETFRSEHLTNPFHWSQLTKAELKDFGLKTGDCIRFQNFLRDQTKRGEPEFIDEGTYKIGEPDLGASAIIFDEDDEKMDEIAAPAEIKNGRDLISVLISSEKPIQYRELTTAITRLNICCHIVNFKALNNVAQFELIKKHFENLKPHFNRLKAILYQNIVHTIDKIRIKQCQKNNNCSNYFCYFFHEDGLNRFGSPADLKIYCKFGSRCRNPLSCRFAHPQRNNRRNVNHVEDILDIFLEASRQKVRAVPANSPKIIDEFCFTFAVSGKCTKSNCRYRHIKGEKIICPEFKVAGECKRSRCSCAHHLFGDIIDLAEDSVILKNARKKFNQEQKKSNDEKLRKLKEDNAKLSAQLEEQIKCINSMEKEMKKKLKEDANVKKKKRYKAKKAKY